MAADVPERFEDFVTLVEALHKEILRIKSEQAQRLGFTGADVMCLFHLSRTSDGLTSADLARLCEVSRAAMSKTVSRLGERGLVCVSDGEQARYRALVTLTPAGRQAAASIDHVLAEIFSSLGDPLPGELRQEAYLALRKILATLRTVREDR